MGSGKPIPARTRTAIVAELREGKKLAQIARRHKVSPSAVKAIRIAEGLQPLPTEESKILAAQARDVMLLDAHRRQGELRSQLLDEAKKLLDSMHQPAKVFAFGGRDYGYVEQEIDEPDLKGKQALMISVGIAIDKAVLLEKIAQEGASTAKAAIIDLFDRMAVEEKSA